MRIVYEGIGRLVVAFVRARFGRQLRIAGAVAVAVVAVAAYLAAAREPAEG